MLTNERKVRLHRVRSIVENVNRKIVVDIPIKTDINVKYNKPDIIVFDKIRKKITIVEIEVTSIENLAKIEVEKRRKYELLADEIKQILKKSVK